MIGSSLLLSFCAFRPTYWATVSNVKRNEVTKILREQGVDKARPKLEKLAFQLVKTSWGVLAIDPSAVPRIYSPEFQSFLAALEKNDQSILADKNESAAEIISLFTANDLETAKSPNKQQLKLDIKLTPFIQCDFEQNGYTRSVLPSPKWDRATVNSGSEIDKVTEMSSGSTKLDLKVDLIHSGLSASKVLKDYATWIEAREKSLNQLVDDLQKRLQQKLYEQNPGLENFLTTKGGSTGPLTPEAKKWLKSSTRTELAPNGVVSNLKFHWCIQTSVKTSDSTSRSTLIPIEDLFVDRS